MVNDSELFLFPAAAPHLPEVDEWLSGNPPELYAIARQWFAVFRSCGTDVKELLHDGCPTACVDSAAFGYVNVFKSHVNVGFYAGVFLDDTRSLLEGTGKRMRHIKLRPGVDADSDAIGELIHDAYRDIKARL
jgi:hypothetical protein